MKTVVVRLLQTLIIMVSACQQPEKKEATPAPSSPQADTLEIPAPPPARDLLTNTRIVYEDTARILTVGQFHNGEVGENAEKESWFGIFSSENNYYLQQTGISTRRVKDDLLDMEGEISGWIVETPNPHDAVLLVSGLSYLKNKPISKIPLEKTDIFPQDTLEFTHHGVQYILFATGSKKKTLEDPVWYEASDYKLYLSMVKDGHTTTQLLVAHPDFDGAITGIIFAGDIDDDQIPDLIINTSRHYNVTSPALFLSMPAKKGQILKAVGEHRTVGC